MFMSVLYKIRMDNWSELKNVLITMTFNLCGLCAMYKRAPHNANLTASQTSSYNDRAAPESKFIYREKALMKMLAFITSQGLTA